MPTSDRKTVLVTGATGQQGGAVARLLLQNGHRVRALTRTPESGGAKALAQLGAELVKGTMDDAKGLTAAAGGVDTVFVVTTPFEAGMEAEVRQGTNAADAAKAAGADVVFTSVAWAWAKTGIPHFESKWQVEEHIRSIGVPHTIIRPSYFMENVIAPWSLPALREGIVAVPLTSQVPVVMISVANIGEFAVLAIENRDRMQGRGVDIGADIVTGEESARVLSEATGRQFRYVPVPIDDVRKTSEDLATMFDYYEKTRPTIDIDALKREYPEIAWRSYATWAGDQDWKAMLS